MPRHSSVLRGHISPYIKLLEKEGRSERTAYNYWHVLLRATEALDEAGLETNPLRIGSEEIDFLRNDYYSNLKPYIARLQLSIVGTYLDWHGNQIVRRMKIAWPQDARIHVDWLTREEALRLMASAQGIERMLIHLELCIGLRRCEVLRLRIGDIRPGCFNVLGKGRMGGKPRTVPFHPDTIGELRYYLAARDETIRRAVSRRPDQKAPEALIVHACYRSRIRIYGETALDGIVKRAAARAGILHCSNHTLRRTCGRLHWQAGTPIETIRKILGHEKVETTLEYIGINFDDMQAAMVRLGEYLHSPSVPPDAGNGPPRADSEAVIPGLPSRIALPEGGERHG